MRGHFPMEDSEMDGNRPETTRPVHSKEIVGFQHPEHRIML